MKRPVSSGATRFAPSPNGYLHLGHAFSALTVERLADKEALRFLLRIEDIDPERCRPEYEAALYEDLAWLGLCWEQPVRRQSEHMPDYRAALDRLDGLGVLYPCFCSRRQLAEAGGTSGTEGPLYPGTCRALPLRESRSRVAAGEPHTWRLDSAKADAVIGSLSWHDREAGTVPVDPGSHGDVVLARRDVPTSYHLSVTVDDHLQGITLVVRGTDLFAHTSIHRTLQALLGFETPDYYHHPLLIDPATGDKLAKSARSTSLRELRAAGLDAEEVRKRARFLPG